MGPLTEPHVSFRRWRPDQDADWVCANYEHYEFASQVPLSDISHARTEVAAWAHNSRHHAVLADDGRLVGSILTVRFEPTPERPAPEQELLYWVGRSERKKGYARAAVRAALAELIDDDAETVFGMVRGPRPDGDEGNVDSRNVLELLGFTRTFAGTTHSAIHRQARVPAEAEGAADPLYSYERYELRVRPTLRS